MSYYPSWEDDNKPEALNGKDASDNNNGYSGGNSLPEHLRDTDHPAALNSRDLDRPRVGERQERDYRGESVTRETDYRGE